MEMNNIRHRGKYRDDLAFSVFSSPFQLFVDIIIVVAFGFYISFHSCLAIASF